MKFFRNMVALLIVCVISLLGGGSVCVMATEGQPADGQETGGEAKTKIYFNNSEGWDKVNIWSWTMEYTDQLVPGVWPGPEMESAGDGWFVYELEVSEDFAILFNNGETTGTVQTADLGDLAAGKTYWFVISGEAVENSSGLGGGVTIEAFEEPEADWPEASGGTNEDPSGTDETSGTDEDPSGTDETSGTDDDPTEKDGETEKTNSGSNEKDEDKDGIDPLIIIIIAVVIVACGGIFFFMKKK